MTRHDRQGSTRECDECRSLSRRRFLRTTGAAALLSAALPAWLPRIALSQSGPARDVMVFIYLRGGADGLSLCVPHQEAEYYQTRPTEAIPPPGSAAPNRAIDLDGFFGFPRGFQPLMDAFQAGHLLVVHATGLANSTRSHGTAQFRTEAANGATTVDYSVASGWLGRHLATSTPVKAGARLRGLAFDAGRPLTMAGGPKTISLKSPTSTFSGIVKSCLPMFDNTLEPVRTEMLNMQEGIKALGAIDFRSYQPGGGAVYPSSDFGKALKAAATLIQADIGIEAIEVDSPKWDTHGTQGSVNGFLASHMGEFAAGLSAFHADISSGSHRNVTLVVMSEFGRQVRENSSKGTDHGHGGIMLVMGERIAGGRVLAEWPGLAHDQLFEGLDLEVTIDCRDILAEIVKNCLGNPYLDQVFPNHTSNFRGVTR